MFWTLSLFWDMGISVALGLYPIHVSSASILNHERSAANTRRSSGPLSAQKSCTLAPALEVSGLGTTRPSMRPSQSLPSSSSSQYPITSRQALIIPDTNQDLLGRRPFLGKKERGNTVSVGPNEDPAGSGPLPVWVPRQGSHSRFPWSTNPCT